MPKIFCINLKRRTDRWEHVTEEIKKMGEEYELVRFDAIDNKKNPASGTAESFITLIKQAKENNMPNIHIIEDDLVLHENSNKIWKEAVDNLPDDWDILLGGVYYCRNQKKINDHMVKTGDFCSLHFVMFNAKCYDKVLSYKVDNLKLTHIDRFLGRLSQKGELNVYIVWPMFAKQMANYSDIRKREVDDNKRKSKTLEFLF